ncbi:MAG TPA: MFS transporter [Candidatus Limnocylindrales bacterium]|nr:MFS transporter [Candidatus Limnocylindrales bacterium]
MDATATSAPPPSPILGLRANAGQFALLVVVNALVGGMVGQERTVLPLLARDVFGLGGLAVAMTFVAAFGITKAVTNLVAGALSDRYGRRPVLIAGWLVGLPVPILLIVAPEWAWVIAANVLLGINQGLTWSTTVVMKVDLVGPARRGLATGLNEAAGYGAVAVTALATGWLAGSAGLRPAPFLLGLAYALLGLGLSAALVRETRAHAHAEGRAAGATPPPSLPFREAFLRTSVRDPSLSAASQAGFVNNLNDGMAWGVLPVFWASAGLGLPEIGLLAAAYPAVWAIAQIPAGAWSDRIGRKPLIVAGMLIQGAAIVLIAIGSGVAVWLVAAIALGFGTALVYPTLLAAVADVADPSWRASAIGTYRLWRDLGFGVGAIVVGLLADRLGLPVAIGLVGALTAASGLVVLGRMRETRPLG